MRSFALAVAVLVLACSGDSPTEIDANPAGPSCTGAIFDPCNTEHDCMSAMCHTYTAEGFQVCTKACTPGDNTTCPPQNGVASTCNAMGICKPAAPNMCHL